jgi:hypothetical protein
MVTEELSIEEDSLVNNPPVTGEKSIRQECFQNFIKRTLESLWVTFVAASISLLRTISILVDDVERWRYKVFPTSPPALQKLRY